MTVESAPLRTRRVVFLNWRDTAHPEGGGSERYVEQVAEGLAAAGDDVSILCAGHARAHRDELRRGVRYRRRGGRLTVYPRALVRLWRLPADLVVDVQNGVPFFSRLVARCPVVVLVHHVHREQWPVVLPAPLARLGWWLESRVAPRVYRGCRYVAVSAATRRELVSLGVRAEDIVIVHNATDPVPATPARRAEQPTLCVLGRLVPHKQVDHALEVVARLRGRWPGLRLVVAGEGYAAADLRSRAAALGVVDAIDFLGFVAEPTKHAVLAGSWVHLLPSLKEGWGRVVMEAAGHGVPTVAYRAAGGVTEAVLHGRTGLLARDRDDFVECVAMLLADARLRDRLGTAARSHAAGFGRQSAVAAFSRLLDRRQPQRVP